MAEAVAFDTHRFVKHLTREGFTLGQAEALAEEQVNLINSNLATKADIAEITENIAGIEAALKADIARFEATLKAEIAGTEATLKADIIAIEAALKTDIAATNANIATIEATLKADMAALKVDLLKWMFGALIAQGGLIVALVKLL